MKIYRWILALGLLILSACAATPTTNPPPPSPTPISATSTPAPSATATSTPTAIPQPTTTPAPTMTVKGTEPAKEATKMITLTVLYDNNAYDADLTTAWGFSCLVERSDEETTILFDTGGQGDLLLSNMNILGKDPQAIETVVLSHNHGDHTGGLSRLLQQGLQPKVYVPTGFPALTKGQIRAAAELIEVDDPAEIAPGIWTTGQIDGPIPEQALAVETAEGWIVITGCAHPGVVEMARAAKEATDGEIRLVMGGFHLGSASEQQIARIIEDFQALGVQRVAPMHCTGDTARQRFAAAFGEACDLVGVGATFSFPSEQ